MRGGGRGAVLPSIPPADPAGSHPERGRLEVRRDPRDSPDVASIARDPAQLADPRHDRDRTADDPCPHACAAGHPGPYLRSKT